MSHKSLSGFIGFSSSSNFVSLQEGQKDSDIKRLQALESVSNQELENIRRAAGYWKASARSQTLTSAS